MIDMKCKASYHFIHSITYLSPQIENRKRKGLIYSTQTFMHASIHPYIPDVLVLVQIFPLKFSHQGIRPPTQSKAKQGKARRKASAYLSFRACVLCISKSVFKRKENRGQGSREMIVCDGLRLLPDFVQAFNHYSANMYFYSWDSSISFAVVQGGSKSNPVHLPPILGWRRRSTENRRGRQASSLEGRTPRSCSRCSRRSRLSCCCLAIHDWGSRLQLRRGVGC
jgi:hypothetical protein